MLAAISSSGSVAQATEISYFDYSILGENTHLTLAPDATIYAGMGAINLKTKTSTIETFCVDVTDWLLNSGTYSVLNPGLDANLTGLSGLNDGNSKVGDISALLSHGERLASRPKANGALIDAAIQYDIWRVEYGNTITITPDNSQVTPLALTYADNVVNHTWSEDLWRIHELVPVGAAPNQSLVFDVDEPPVTGILALGMLAVWMMTRSRRKNNANPA